MPPRSRKRDIHAAVITDGHDDEQCGIIAHIREVKKRPLELGGPWDR